MTVFARALVSLLTLPASLYALADTKPILIGQTYVQSGPLASLATERIGGFAFDSIYWLRGKSVM